MTLLDRVIGLEQPKVPIHLFMSLISEYARDFFEESVAVRRQRIIDACGVTPAEEAQMDQLIAASESEYASIQNGNSPNGPPPGQGRPPNGRQTAVTSYSHELHNVLVLGESLVYDSAQCHARLGV